ncbi:hypothetical protein BU23DRAFT_629837 [Bimuria novae-zelandiae CBS 107.79]|uniref:Uncharacterized protein n=1 Tax=Bimuria novae-zelandiae CBS 107.79 TaxID=1447943 RepID=A0A6A5VFE0_9PLEO|nr:hypothetical protein BU23DRAFT_629837 [Bimuria novae-zelandiae CBS 107.79]
MRCKSPCHYSNTKAKNPPPLMLLKIQVSRSSNARLNKGSYYFLNKPNRPHLPYILYVAHTSHRTNSRRQCPTYQPRTQHQSARSVAFPDTDQTNTGNRSSARRHVKQQLQSPSAPATAPEPADQPGPPLRQCSQLWAFSTRPLAIRHAAVAYITQSWFNMSTPGNAHQSGIP